jgi:hypothetical protein
MHTLVIGGHSRNIGKTALVADLIRAIPEAEWTALKITQYGHGFCSLHGEPCRCSPDAHGVALDEETSRDNRTDTSRFLVAGAARAFWLRVEQGRMAEAMPKYREAVAGARHIIVESNTLLRFLRPDTYLVVLDPAVEDFKDSARQMLDRADMFVLRSPLEGNPWPGVSRQLLERRPCVLQPLGAALPEALERTLRERLFGPPGG